MLLSEDIKAKIVDLVKNRLGDQLLAVYVFGSVASGEQHSSSDLDLAILCHEKPEAELAFALKTDLAESLKRNIDLVDLFRADSVTKAQVISTGEVLFVNNSYEVAAFETRAYSEYALLNEERAGIIEDLLKRGSISG